jgi:CAAX prenyl protease-like protein
MQQPQQGSDQTRPISWRPRVRDDVAYFLPMLTFLAFTQVGVWYRDHFAATYIAKTIVVAALLAIFWPNYTRVRWNHWWLGVIVGVIGIFQWVPMQLWLQRHFELFRPSGDAFNPYDAFAASPAMLYTFFAFRVAGAVLVVPVMEELFWRDFGWRTVLAPNDFKLAEVGEWGWSPFLIISGVFALVHGNWWLTSIVWAMMVGLLLVYTKSIGACIIAHAVTNLLLAVYVLKYEDWAFW